MDKILVRKNLVKEVFKEVEKLSSQFGRGEILITNVKEVQKIVWKIYYHIWQNNTEYNSVITLEELKKIHNDYNQKVLVNN